MWKEFVSQMRYLIVQTDGKNLVWRVLSMSLEQKLSAFAIGSQVRNDMSIQLALLCEENCKFTLGGLRIVEFFELLDC